MSRAFVKEQDDAVEELPERSISEHPNDVTPEGAARIDAELGAARTGRNCAVVWRRGKSLVPGIRAE